MEQTDGIDMYVENIFEPLTRARSNTWPLPRPEGYVDGPLIDGAAMTGNTEIIKTDQSTQQTSSGQGAGPSTMKKKMPRRNAWGKLSYAELITQAINSSKDQRLTLAQIYEWMVKNVQYFNDKGDTSSSAGWKNSVRHNLSLHDCFIRVPNESSGKSSWWTINPDAKTGRTTRRRAATMEAGKFERRRARAKKQAEISRKASLHADLTSGESSSVCEGMDSLHYGSPLQHRALQSPAFRPRASSSASSCGRLSPIPAANEPKWTQGHTHSQVVAGLVEQSRVTPTIHQINHASQLDQQLLHLPVAYQMEQQEALANDFQNLPAGYSFDQQVPQSCPLHSFGVCNCDLSTLQMERQTQAASAATSYVYFETDQQDRYIYGNRYGMMTSQTTLMPIQEMADFGSIADLQNESQQPLVRNNSMLDDIDEIIRKEQYTGIDLVNASMSTALYISGSNPINPVGQNSWIHL